MANPQKKTHKLDDNRKYVDSDLTNVKALGAGQFEGIVATSSMDRHGEVLDVKGLDVTKYVNTNPIVLFGHDYWEAESVIGRSLSLTKTKAGELLSRFELFTAENPKAALVAKLIKKGVLALSIGFIPTEIEGDTYTKSEMVEYSVVPVPANAEAAITARSLGLSKKEMGILGDVLKKEITPETLIADEDTETKGAVQDELDAEAMWEAKRANLDSVCDIWWAFIDVYCSQKSAVDDFDTLLKEVVGLFTQVLAGTYVDPDPEDAEGDDDVDEDEEYPVTYALKRAISDERMKELMQFVQKQMETTEVDDEKVVDNSTTSKSIADDGDVNAVANLAQTLIAYLDDGDTVHDNMRTVLEALAGGTATAKEAEEEQSTGGDPDLSASNTVKETKTTKTKVGDVEEEVTETVETPVTEADPIEVLKKIDKSNLNADTIKQLAADLRQMAVELEEDATELASSTTDGANSPIARKRKFVMKQARKKVVRVDKLVELTLAQLPK